MFSPPLDARGNSARGVQVCEALSRELGLHFLQPPRLVASTVRARYDLAQVRSKRHRPPQELRVLEEHGSRAVVFELQGDLRFATLEPVLREVVDAGSALQYVEVGDPSAAIPCPNEYRHGEALAVDIKTSAR